MMDIEFIAEAYKGKKVFLTGHTGFKGAWLLQWLHILGAEIKGYSLPPNNSNDLYNLIDGDSLCDSVIADIMDKEKVEDAVLRFQPDFIFHLAAQPLVRLSYEYPSETFAVNALGTAHVLDAVKKLKKSCVVLLITTDKVYENKEWEYPYRENDRLGGFDPYSASKACAEIIINSYTSSFFNPNDYHRHQKAMASIRAGNVIGGGDWSKDRIIPDIVRALMANEPVSVRNPDSVRPWQHVLEPLGGYLFLGAKLTEDPVKYGGAWNFGPLTEDNLRVEDLVQTALKVWRHGDYKKTFDDHQLHEARLLKLDISKAVNLLQWKPQYTSSEAIEYTMAWYKAFVDKEEIKEFTVSQICAYSEKCDLAAKKVII